MIRCVYQICNFRLAQGQGLQGKIQKPKRHALNALTETQIIFALFVEQEFFRN